MANMGAYKPKNAYQYNNTKYAKKTSDNGHYEPEVTGKRYGRDGSMANFTTMNWVEDNRDFSPEASEPTPEIAPPEPDSPDVSPEIEYSPEIQSAQNFVDKYERTASPYTDSSSQDFLDFYKQRLTSGENSTAVEPINYSLNLDRSNTEDTSNLNQFANTTGNPVKKSDQAAQNFLSQKKSNLLNNL